jgi:2-phosphosulfolactate phosphatase
VRVHVALTPAEPLPEGLGRQAAVVVDVLRATTVVVAACAAGCRAVHPVTDPQRALEARAGLPPGTGLLAGERGGEPIPGFDLGNSPLEFLPVRVRGRTIILTTSNGTDAMLRAAGAAAAAVAALTNVEAVARWAARQARDLTVLCAGEGGGFSLEDAVGAGLLVESLATAGAPLDCSAGATAARRLADYYGGRLDRLREDSGWARHLDRAGRAADLAACLRVGGLDLVPVFGAGGLITTGALS